MSLPDVFEELKKHHKERKTHILTTHGKIAGTISGEERSTVIRALAMFEAETKEPEEPGALKLSFSSMPYWEIARSWRSRRRAIPKQVHEKVIGIMKGLGLPVSVEETRIVSIQNPEDEREHHLFLFSGPWVYHIVQRETGPRGKKKEIWRDLWLGKINIFKGSGVPLPVDTGYSLRVELLPTVPPRVVLKDVNLHGGRHPTAIHIQYLEEIARKMREWLGRTYAYEVPNMRIRYVENAATGGAIPVVQSAIYILNPPSIKEGIQALEKLAYELWVERKYRRRRR